MSLGLLAGGVLAGSCGQAQKTVAADVWAVVDDHEIRKDEVEKMYRTVTPATATPSDDEMMTVKLGIVDELITQEVLLARGKVLKIEIPDADVNKAFEERKQNLTDEAFQAQLKQRNLNPDDMKQSLRRELTANKVLDQEVVSTIVIGEKEISDFYTQHRAEFNVAEPQYRIAQIVITPIREQQIGNRLNDDATTQAEADAKAQLLMAKLKAGAEFSAIAMDYSEDAQSAANGGDLGFIPASRLGQAPAQLRDAVLKSQPGGVTLVSNGGAHNLVLLVAKEAAGQRELSNPAVRTGISTTLKQRRENLLRAAYITKMRNGAKIMNYLARQIIDARPITTPAPVLPGKK